MQDGAPGTGPTLTVHAPVSRREWLRYSLAFLTRPKRLLLVLPLSAAFGVYFLYRFGGGPLALADYLTFAVVLAGAFAAALGYGALRADMAWRARRDEFLGATYTFREDALEVSHPGARTEHPWDGFRGVVEQPRWYALYPAKGPLLLIPKEATEQSGTTEAVRAFLMARAAGKYRRERWTGKGQARRRREREKEMRGRAGAQRAPAGMREKGPTGRSSGWSSRHPDVLPRAP